LSNSLPSEMFDHYRQIDESERLSSGAGELEQIRTKELVERTLPKNRSVILDVGGAAGIYSLWLARQGHEVHLIDPVPDHVARAQAASEGQAMHPLAGCEVGDARDLRRPDASADVVLMLGPLYHLTERSDRLRALREAHRALRPTGVIFAAAVSRFASLLSGMTYGFLGDPVFADIIRRDLADGQHRNPTGNPLYFTKTFFHHPDELRTEMAEAGFTVDSIAAIEGPAMWMKNFDSDWQDERRRSLLLEFLRTVETEPAIVATGSHFLGIGHKLP
jgi:2-polyprenyl-3-methyl-5-hydroxy-6-metoxy-1,4-benzoquinol methylase